MNQRARLLSLIDDLYASPGTEEGWAFFLDNLCAGVSGSGASFISIATGDRRASVAATVRTDPEALKAYQRHWGALDPWGRSPKISTLPATTVVRGDDLISHSALKQTAFYCDFGRHVDIVRCVVGIIETGRQNVSVISINGTDRRGAFSSEDTTLLTALMPHLQRGLQLHRRLLTSETTAEDFTALVDAVPNAVIFVNRYEHRQRSYNRAESTRLGWRWPDD